jgi:alkanesulfonate monooxygenase SsuD/methylene tetrahydromethanopterin reductase-like flavin-dependent oxidoreductase (luciferase family)
MKISMIDVFGHRELPADFRERYHSIWVDPPWSELATPEQYARFYDDSLEELLFAAEHGFDGLVLNEHHQNTFGGLPNPNVMAGALAHATRDRDVAIVQLGSTLTTITPPLRIAEEYAMLDVLSHGRLVAGMPVGGPPCASLCYGVPPLEQRERYYEAHDLIMKAWAAEDVFAWNGKYFQLPFVNVWPRPMQTPHPPVWVPGVSSTSTWDFAALNDYAYMTLSAFSGSFGINGTLALMRGFWDRIDAHGKDHNPFRAGIAIFPMVGDSMAQVERDFAEHISYVFRHFQHIAPPFLSPPGYQDYGGLLRMCQQANAGGAWSNFDEWTFSDYVDHQVVVAGTPHEVADQIEQIMRTGNAGHLMVMLQWGSMPKGLALDHIAAFGEGVIPRLRPLWEDEWEDHWWPERLRGGRALAPSAVAPSAVAPSAVAPAAP